MKVLMFGWEFSPRYNGGLGIACNSLVKAMEASHEITFLLPKYTPPKKPKIQHHAQNKTVVKDIAKINEKKVVHLLRSEKTKYLDLYQNLLPYARTFSDENESRSKRLSRLTLSEEQILSAIPMTGKYGKNLPAEVVKYTVSCLLYTSDAADD